MRTEYEFKIVVIGDQSVGKTSILNRFASDTFDKNVKSTIGTAFVTKRINLTYESVNLQIWDTAGQEAFRSLQKIYYQSADGALLVFDLTNLQSLKNVVRWYNELRNNVDKDNLVVYLIGNKADLVDVHTMDRGSIFRYAEQLEAKTYFTSAKQGSGIQVQDMFQTLASALVQKDVELKQKSVRVPRKSKKLVVSEDKIPEKQSCC